MAGFNANITQPRAWGYSDLQIRSSLGAVSLLASHSRSNMKVILFLMMVSDRKALLKAKENMLVTSFIFRSCQTIEAQHQN